MYYEGNADKVKATVKKYRQDNPRDEKRHQTLSFRRWLNRGLIQSRRIDGERGRPHDLTLDFVVELVEKQGFKCAVTGLPLTHKFNDLFSASIDRICAKGGHTCDNVQIVCMAINLMRRHYPIDQLRAFLDAYFELRMEQEGIPNLYVDYIAKQRAKP